VFDPNTGIRLKSLEAVPADAATAAATVSTMDLGK